MNTVCTAILHLNNSKLKNFNGNYDNFIQVREESKIFQQKSYEKEQFEILKLKKYINENSCGFNVDQAQSRVKALKRLTDNGLTEKVEKDY